MTDPLHSVKKLAQIARRESIPALDVASCVMRSIHERKLPLDNAPFRWIAWGAGACAALMLIIAVFPLYQAWTDPLILSLMGLFWGLL
ncbi:MAG: hypothetical protein AB1847_17435 [bacterium]